MRYLTIVLSALTAVAMGAAAAHAEGPAPAEATATKVSLPDGPASVRGLGSDADVGLFSGQLEYSVSFELPPGYAGFGPTLGIGYFGELGNGPVGVGWHLSHAAIRRTVRDGVPTFTDADELELVGLGGGGRLVAVPGHGLRVEGRGNKLRVVRDGRRYKVFDSDGTTYYFGLTDESRQQDGDRTFAWFPELVVHRSGESIHFDYLHDRGQVYLARVSWGPDQRFQVLLEYERRHDSVISFREGMRVETAQRLAHVRVLSRSADGDSFDELRAYHLLYDGSRSLSRVSGVQMTGYQGEGSLPTLSFGYAGGETSSAAALTNTDGWRLEERGVAFLDVNGDGADDLVRLEMGNHEYRLNLGGRFGPRTRLYGATALELDDVSFIDLDGDARPELVRVVDDTWRYSRLEGDQWTAGAEWPGTRGVPLHSDGQAIVDIDGDGRMDVVESTTGGLRWWRNGALGLAPPVSRPQIDPSNLLIEPGAEDVRMLDVNGDGLADVVWLNDAWMKVFLGRGDGTFVPWRRTFYPWSSGTFVDIRDLRLADLDRDGLLDLVRFTAGHVLMFPGSADGSFDRFSLHLPRPESVDADVTVAISDANGNGSQDVLWSSPRGMWVLDLAGATSAGMLSSIDNGLGQVSRFRYRSSAELSIEAANAGVPWNHLLPSATPVPISTTVDVGDGSPLRVEHYSVRDGVWDGIERRFAGFLESRKAIAAEHARDTFVEVTRYHAGLGDDRVLRGRVHYVRMENGLGQVNTETFTEWVAHPVDYGTDATAPALRVAITREVRTRHHEGVAEPIDTLTWYEHDTQARVVAENRVGRVDMEGDESRVERRYAADDDERWIRDRACREIVIDPERGVLSQTRTLYGDISGPLAPDCEVGAGLVREVAAWLADDTQPRWVPRVSNTYTQHWNPSTVTTNGVSRTFAYDRDDLRLIHESVAPNESRSLEWNLEWDDTRGLALALTGPNGNTARVAYDALARPLSMAINDAPPHVHYRYDWNQHLPATTTYAYDGAVTTPPVFSGQWVETDPWRQTVAIANGAGEPVASAVRVGAREWIVSGARDRDARGRTVRLYEPAYWTGDDPRLSRPVDDTPAQTYDYDAFNRVRVQSLPTGGHRRTEFTAFGERVVGDDVEPVSSEQDGAGRIVHTERTVAGTVETADATYDAAGRLVEISLQNGAVRHSYEFDSLGRLTYAHDPDVGPRYYLWDHRSLLIEMTNAAGQTIAYDYDGIGRLSEVLADDGTSFRYHYDIPLDAAHFTNTAGRLAWVEEPTGRAQLGYDLFGNPDRYQRTIDGTSATEESLFSPSGLLRAHVLDSELRIEIDYDAAGRPSTITESASDRPYGTLWRVPSPRDDLDAAGRILREEYGNGIAQSYVVDANGAPSRIAIARNADDVLYDVSVARNAWSGITQAVSNDDFGVDHSATFEYDGGTRLVSASIGASSEPAVFTYRYDGLQNMVERQATGPTTLDMLAGTYRYGGARPDGTSHGPRQLTAVADPADPTKTVATFDYDAAGRRTRHQDRQLTYNGLDQLVRVDQPGVGSTSYAYGFDGLRVRTSALDGSVTRWLTPSISQQDGERTHYIKLGDRLIARITKIERQDQRNDGSLGITWSNRALFAILVLGSFAILLSLVAPRPTRSSRLAGATTALLVFAVFHAGCGLFSSGRQYSWSSGEVVYFHHGYAAGPILITRQDGSVVADRQYEPFGAPLAEAREGVVGGGVYVADVDYSLERHNVFNKPADEDTGWSYHGARWMTPESAQWLTPDPPTKAPDPTFMAQPWGLHPYQYVDQNPVAYWDPNGRSPCMPGGYLYTVGEGTPYADVICVRSQPEKRKRRRAKKSRSDKPAAPQSFEFEPEVITATKPPAPEPVPPEKAAEDVIKALEPYKKEAWAQRAICVAELYVEHQGRVSDKFITLHNLKSDTNLLRIRGNYPSTWSEAMTFVQRFDGSMSNLAGKRPEHIADYMERWVDQVRQGIAFVENQNVHDGSSSTNSGWRTIIGVVNDELSHPRGVMSCFAKDLE